MRIRLFVATLPIVVLGVWATTSAMAQSLADVARQEDSRRRVVQPAAKVYTNGDLAPAVQPAPSASATTAPEGTSPDPLPGSAGRAAQAPPAPAAAAGDKAETAPVAADTAPKDEAYWRNRLKGLRDQLAQNQSYAEAMQTRISVLTLEFTSRTNAAQRTRTGVERQKAIADLERLKVAIETDKKAITALEEEARRTRVPAGWLR
jgi:hypothetical protein